MRTALATVFAVLWLLAHPHGAPSADLRASRAARAAGRLH